MQQFRLYGLTGHPVGHSYSATWFGALFAREGIAARYENFDLASIGELPALLAGRPALCGFNVTSPYKRQIIPYLSWTDPVASRVGAVNTVVVSHDADGKVELKGYNTDVGGFADSLAPLLTPQVTGALVLGSGGASSAVVEGLQQSGIRATVVSRTPTEDQLSYESLTREIIADNLLIVNATPLGMAHLQDLCPPIPYDCLTPDHIAYDLVYNPPETLFMQRAAAAGARTVNGLEMLLGQARRAWQLWRADAGL